MSPTHFDGDQNFLELFLPKQFSSADRARVFLWLIHYYHEGPDVPNPYDDDFSSKHRPRVPRIHRLNREAIAAENKDTAEERAWGQQMSNERAQFLSRLVTVHGGKEPSASGYFVAGRQNSAYFMFSSLILHRRQPRCSSYDNTHGSCAQGNTREPYLQQPFHVLRSRGIRTWTTTSATARWTRRSNDADFS